MQELDRDVQRTTRRRVARSKGALSGVLLVALGAWGALIPYLGPTFGYAYTPDTAWTWTAGRFWLELLPGAAVVVAGILLLVTASRAVGVVAGYLGAAAGAWFVVGPSVSRLWAGPDGAAGTPVGGTNLQVLEELGFFYGLGALILFVSATALGRFTVRSLRDVRAAERHVERSGTARPAAGGQSADPAAAGPPTEGTVSDDNSASRPAPGHTVSDSADVPPPAGAAETTGTREGRPPLQERLFGRR